MKVSVIVCTSDSDRLASIKRTLGSIKDQTHNDCEIIVAVDQNVELLRKLKEICGESISVLLNNEKKGLSSTRNVGIKSAMGDVIAFIDDDAFAEKSWLENLLTNYQDGKVLGAGGKVISSWQNGRPSWFSEELDWIVGCSYKGGVETKTRVARLIGCNMSFRKEVFEKVGYFNSVIGQDAEKPLLRGDDTEFCFRILNLIPDGIIIHDPSAIVYHNVPESRASIRYAINRAFSGGRSIKAILNSAKLTSADGLSAEKKYLKYLLNTAIVRRLRKPKNLGDIIQIAVIFLCFTSHILGFSFETLTGIPRILARSGKSLR